MRLVIMDRDGVINQESAAYIKSPEEWIPISGSLEAIARLNKAGFVVVIASNQSGVGRGLFSLKTLEAIHARMQSALGAVGGHLDGIFFCPHKPEDDCDCRKPKTGLFRQIAEHFHIGLEGVPFIGDSPRDITVARAVGARPILVRTGDGERTLRQMPETVGVEVYADLAEAASKLINEIH